MENNQFSRTINLIGNDNFEKIKNKRIIIFGIGGVGGYTVEALVRAGIGSIDIVDKDVVDESNINRQIIATYNTIGKNKTDVMRDRILSINPKCQVTTYNMFFLPENSHQFDFTKYDYVIDCVDTITAKIEIISLAKANNIKVISSMGTGNKLDPSKFEIADINQTSICPLARVMRYELKKRNIKDVKVLYSKELPIESKQFNEETKKPTPGSISFVPSVAGLLIASYVINDIIK